MHRLISSFQAGVVTADAELTAVAAAAELMRGSPEEGTRCLALAAAGAASVPADRRGRFHVMLAVLRLYLARQRGDFLAVTEEAEQLQSADWLDMAQLGFGDELRALWLIGLGIAELWSLRTRTRKHTLSRALPLRVGSSAPSSRSRAWRTGEWRSFRSPALAAERGSQAIELARRHGLSEEPLAAIAYPALAGSLIWQGELDEAERWLKEGERALPSGGRAADPDAAPARPGLSRNRPRPGRGGAIRRARAERRPDVRSSPRTRSRRGCAVSSCTSSCDWERPRQAERNSGRNDEEEREQPGVRTGEAALLLAQATRGGLRRARARSQPSAPPSHQVWPISAFLLEASARDAW